MKPGRVSITGSTSMGSNRNCNICLTRSLHGTVRREDRRTSLRQLAARLTLVLGPR